MWCMRWCMHYAVHGDDIAAINCQHLLTVVWCTVWIWVSVIGLWNVEQEARQTPGWGQIWPLGVRRESDKFVETVGFSGTKQLIQVTAPVRITTGRDEIKILILISNQTPINLLGRDVLWKPKIKIWYSLEDVYVKEDVSIFKCPFNQKELRFIGWRTSLSWCLKHFRNGRIISELNS